MKLKCFLAAFDFDHTIINDNSDIVVSKLLKEVPKYSKNGSWTHYMDDIFKLLHENNISEDDIRKAVVSIPPVANTIEMLRKIKENDCEIVIISDANTYFINEWLKAHDLLDCIDKVYSNPAEFVNGRLHIRGYQEQDWCKLSPRNMCKGYILFEHIAERQNTGTLFRYVAYCGDGQNDYCPSIKLRADDIVFPRKNYPLEKLIIKTPIKANTVVWEHTDLIVNTLQQLRLINK
ncbi:hypothetical protein O3M35_007157 [Rhynocoris fuscipes]|uniref:Pyridoxal phosphate phosphatase PHOSPHO2 n=1 Tax=Rhynocoris fuscipes TaxID=488301 RepID=A0AAW1DB39_9HEMI